MITRITGFCRCSLVSVLFMFSLMGAYAEQAPNPRGTTTDTANSSISNVVSARTVSGRTSRTDDTDVVNAVRSGTTSVSRTATARPSVTVSRSANVLPSGTNTAVTGRSATNVIRTETDATASRSATVARTATSNSVVRSAATGTANAARAATVNSAAGSRASTARATAVFTDLSAIGGGYAECRDAYATCMDQFCANANDTYRRCICSSRYNDFRNTETAMDEAVNLLAQFEDNNLKAVELSAEEVAAMYSATEGELAIKKDTSAAAKMLAEISELLSGKTKSSSSNSLNSNSLGILTVDFTSDLGDIWGNSATSIFDTSTGVDLSSLVGEDLYTQANKQCLELIADSCENNAVLTMARSAYSIMITQDCNVYEKNINAQKESLEQTVRTAEKYLREARLAEYQSHNSADVNECIASVKSAIQSDAACGANYKRCLDYTGAYINQNTGEAIYSPRLFQLADLILLPGVNASDASDVLGANADFNSFLDSRRMFAETALDSCRDISDIVWEEFKRQALIEIAQAQDEKIEEVKMSCVSTMAECYDTQTGALQDFDNTTSQYSGALSAYAAREMCADKVIACASLYGNTTGCKFDGNGQLVTGNADGSLTGAAASARCGLTALLDFVDTVDNVRVIEGCETAINSYLTDLCTPSGTSDMSYPWNCRNLSPEELTESARNFAQQNCASPTGNTSTEYLTQFDGQINRAVSDITEEMDYTLMALCKSLNGYWVDATNTTGTLLQAFYSSVYGGSLDNTSWGRCIENSTRTQCLNYNETDKDAVASYDATVDECTFTDEWYKSRCALMGSGYYENGICYTTKD